MKRIPNKFSPARVVYGETSEKVLEEMVGEDADVGFARNGEVVVFQRLARGGKRVTIIPSLDGDGAGSVGPEEC